MRNLLLVALLAGSASPAFSQDMDRSGDERPVQIQRSERADRMERAERPVQFERDQAQSEAREARSLAREERRQQRAIRAEPDQGAVQAEPRTMERRPSAFGRQRLGTDIMPRQREIRTIPEVSPAPVVTPPSSITTQHRDRDGRRWNGDRRHWDRHGWRRDHRYDWRRWRDRNRSTFRIGLYIDPFGWGYNRWGIGSRLYPHYYRSSYWITDPWRYRLPDVYGPYRWVRYHNDALLIDTWSGEVVDVIYNFFW